MLSTDGPTNGPTDRGRFWRRLLHLKSYMAATCLSGKTPLYVFVSHSIPRFPWLSLIFMFLKRKSGLVKVYTGAACLSGKTHYYRYMSS